MAFTLWRQCEGGFGCSCTARQEKDAASKKNLKGHGTRAKYQRGCRCLPCKRANAKYHRENMRKRNGTA